MIDIDVSESLADRRDGLQVLLGLSYAVAVGVDPTLMRGVVVLDAASSGQISELRAASPELGIVVLLEEHDECDPRSIMAFIEQGANVCLVAPGVAGLAAHIRALAAHHPDAIAASAILA